MAQTIVIERGHADGTDCTRHTPDTKVNLKAEIEYPVKIDVATSFTEGDVTFNNPVTVDEDYHDSDGSANEIGSSDDVG